MWITSSVTNALTPTTLALGNFDGLHRGHRRVIEPILPICPNPIDRASVLDSSAQPELVNRPVVTVVTFSPHPQEFFTGQVRSLLTPIPEKAQQLESLGVEQLILLPFNQELAQLSPQDFVEIILLEQLQAQKISVGADFCFGHRRLGTAQDLKTLAARHQIPVELVSLQYEELHPPEKSPQRISSSQIRESLQQGQIDRATRLLGRPYQLIGPVVTGQQLARTLQFPTANLQLPPEKFLPRFGVYAVWVQINQDPNFHPGVMNIGYRPTVQGTAPTAEVHLLDWSTDLYQQTLSVHLMEFLRPEQKFLSLRDLQQQIKQDVQQAREILCQTRLP